MRFIGRQPELKLLEQHYAADRAALVPVYGRRRIGKSRLIDEFIRGKPCLYFLGKQATAELQLREFREAAVPVLDNEGLAHARFENWQAALQTVTRLWKRGKKLVLVMDELQWTAEASPELPSVLQGLWDREWKLRSDLMIVLCGSHLGFMEREILGQKSPLFGRRSDQIRLGPLSFPESAKMVSHYSEVDRAGVYFLVGGIPAYLERFSPGRSLHEAIRDEFCSELKFFALEPHFLLREELREPSRYFTILTLMAGHRIRHKDLAQTSRLAPGILAAYLETLGGLGYVSKVYPAVPGRINPRTVQYEIADPLLRFWFRFIFPNIHLCRPGQEHGVFAEAIAPHLEAYFGTRFERLCQESLIDSYRRRHILWDQVGQYWDDSMQIDVVGIRKDKCIDFGECKWGTVDSVSKLLKGLEDKVRRYPNQARFTHGIHLFLKHHRSGGRNSPHYAQVHDLASLFEERPRDRSDGRDG